MFNSLQMYIKRNLIYFFILFILLICYLFVFLFFWIILYGPFYIIWSFFIVSLVFFLKYFLPIYFLLSFYTFKHKGYYHVTFFGYDANLLVIYYNNLKFFLINNLYNYIYLFISLFSLILILIFYKIKIFFFIYLFFSFIYFLIYYFFKISYKLQIYIDKYLKYFNISVILSLIYLLNVDNDNIFDYTNTNNETLSNFILNISLPRMKYKIANSINYGDQYKHKDEISRINRYLLNYDVFLIDTYLLKYKGLNLHNMHLLKIINKNYEYYNFYIQNYNLKIFKNLKKIFVSDHYRCLDINGYKLQQVVLDKDLFDFDFYLNNSSNLIFTDNILKKSINSHNRHLYSNAMYKELLLSKNLVLNMNLKDAVFRHNIYKFYNDNALLDPLDKNLDKCIFTTEYDNIYLNYIKFNYLTYFTALSDMVLYDSIYYEDYNNNNNKLNDYLFNSNKDKNKSYISFLNNFLNDILVDTIKNNYYIYLKSISLDFILILYEKLVNINFRDFNVEMYLNHLYKDLFFNWSSRKFDNINYLNNLLIYLLDDVISLEDYWSDSRSFKDLEDKDAFNILRNLNNNVIYLYNDIKNHENNLNIDSYNYFKLTGEHYEDEDDWLPDSSFNNLLYNKNILYFFNRYAYFNYKFENLINSYLWISLDNFNIQFDIFENMININDYLSYHMYLIDLYTKLYIANYDEELEVPIIDYVNKHHDELMIILKDMGEKDFMENPVYKARLRTIVFIQKYFEYNDFLIDTLFSDETSVVTNDNFISSLCYYNEDFLFFNKYKIINEDLNIYINTNKIYYNYKNSVYSKLFFKYYLKDINLVINNKSNVYINNKY